MSETINLLPNTGHRYGFVKIDEEKLSEAAKNACVENKHEWSDDSNCKWLRWCWGTKDGEKGVCYCIDTNLGGVSRGTRKDIPKECGEKDPKIPQESPFLAESTNNDLPLGVSVPLTPEIKFKLTFEWEDRGSIKPRDVDLVVDFGNTRTIVLAMEHRDVKEKGAKKTLAEFCRPVFFLKRREEFEGETEDERRGEDLSRCVVDSWFVLRQCEFGDLQDDTVVDVVIQKTDKKKGFLRSKDVEVYSIEKLFPQLFVEISPTIMGVEAAKLLCESDLKSGRFSMSSPKRYLWDNEAGVFGEKGELCWYMLPNREGDPKARKLSGQICRYTYPDGRHWDCGFSNKAEWPFLSDPAMGVEVAPSYPTYPRRESMVWSALSIIEMAYREITSYGWRESEPQICRRLNSIALTFPSGWIGEEKRAYKDAWERAVSIFTLSHFENTEASITENRPKVELEVDEAVASQLPFVFSEVENFSKGNKLDGWIRSNGKDDRVRVMSVDIGGGTMDVSVVEYSNRYPNQDTISTKHLQYLLVFRDCGTHAGDNAMKKIIEKVLLPAIFTEAMHGSADEQDDFVGYFSKHDYKADEAKKRSSFIKLVFIPIVQKWLSWLSNSEERDERTTLRDLVGTENSKALEAFKAEIETAIKPLTLDIDDCYLSFDAERAKKIEACIEEALLPGLTTLPDFVNRYDVDLVVLSGKITEVPIVAKLIEDIVPLPPQCIRKMKNYHAGVWYPMARNGRVPDAKTVTAVGAALHRALMEKCINGWSFEEIKAKSGDSTNGKNYWGVIPFDEKQKGFAGVPLLSPDTDESNESMPVSIGSKIGRMSSNNDCSRPTQIYILEWKKGVPEDQKTSDVVGIRLERKFDDEGETIELSAAVDGDDNDITDKLSLAFCTLDGGEFWMDAGRVDVCFEEEK